MVVYCKKITCAWEKASGISTKDWQKKREKSELEKSNIRVQMTRQLWLFQLTNERSVSISTSFIRPHQSTRYLNRGATNKWQGVPLVASTIFVNGNPKITIPMWNRVTEVNSTGLDCFAAIVHKPTVHLLDFWQNSLQVFVAALTCTGCWHQVNQDQSLIFKL